jgi:adenylate cyclase
MRSWCEQIDLTSPNFLVQKGLLGLTDVSGKKVWICDKTWKSPIRAEMLHEKIIAVYCWAVSICLECPFKSVYPDRTDFKNHST